MFFIAACPPGMVYQSCGHLCPQTCDNELSNESCISGCVEGCFCPDGQIVVDGECVHPVSCPGMYACMYSIYVRIYVHTTNAYMYSSIHMCIATSVNVLLCVFMHDKINAGIKSFLCINILISQSIMNCLLKDMHYYQSLNVMISSLLLYICMHAIVT